MCLYVLSSVLYCPLRCPHKDDVRFVLTSSCLKEGSCLAWVVCVCLRMVVSNKCCVVFLLCLSSSCEPYVKRFFWVVHFWLPGQCSLTFMNMNFPC